MHLRRFTGTPAGNSFGVVDAAPRIPPALCRAIEKAARDDELSFAEICRTVGNEARRLDLPRPSYEQVRRHAHAVRRWHDGRAWLAEIAERAKPSPVDAFLDRLARWV